jgi:RimJ/RimL family protein N-acetyltransferase
MEIPQNLELENEKVILKPLHEADLDSLRLLTGNSGFWRFFTHDLSDSAGLSEWAQPALQKERIQFVVIDKIKGKIAGSTGFGNFSARDQRVEIGWSWLGKNFQGKGINSEMKKLMLTYAFETLELKRVEFKTDVLNHQARQALRNIGAIEEGVLRSHTLMTKSRRRDTIYYSILSEEWAYLKNENNW